MSIEYKCKKCPKQYSTYKSLWRHDAIKHKVEISQMLSKIDTDVIINCTPTEKPLPKCEQKVSQLNNQCNICKKLLANRHSRWRHEQNCKNKNLNEIIKKEIEKTKLETQNELL
jgi:hypothetical protein